MKLIENWATIWWKRWSTWLAAVNAALLPLVVANSQTLFGFIDRLPPIARVPLVIAGMVVTFVVPVLTAHVKQDNLHGDA